MTEVLKKERQQIFDDLYSGRISKRVPIVVGFPIEFSIPYCGEDLFEVQWDLPRMQKVFQTICEDFPTDVVPNEAFRLPLYYKILGAKGIVQSSSGFMQHPEISSMQAEEYDEYIADPYTFLCEKVLPRLYTALDTDPVNRSLAFAKAYKAYQDTFAFVGGINGQMTEQYGHWEPPKGSCGFAEAPMDFLADFLRSFSGITLDVRRHPQKVIDACEATIPLMIKAGMPKNPSYLGRTHFPLHMAPFMREKDFKRLWWPSFKKVCDVLAEHGVPVSFFCEHDFTRYLDYLMEFPENTRLLFEYGDPALIKEKVGGKQIISGFYPATLLQMGTQSQCIDKAKELLDVLAPGGKYCFNLDKNVSSTGEDGNTGRNLRAVLEYVAANGSY